MFKAIKIDVVKRSIYEVDLADYIDITKELDCDYYESAERLGVDVICVDEFGRLKGSTHAFSLKGGILPFHVGHGLIIGVSGAAENALSSCFTTIEEATSLISFVRTIHTDNIQPQPLRAPFMVFGTSFIAPDGTYSVFNAGSFTSRNDAQLYLESLPVFTKEEIMAHAKATGCTHSAPVAYHVVEKL